MKKLLVVAALLISALTAKAQTPQVYVGGTGGYSFSNSFVGPVVGFELPVKRFELSGQESFDPIEYHALLGTGHAEQTSLRTDLWLTNHWGVNSQYSVGSYHTQISKASQYVFTGIAWQGIADGQPSKFTFSYFQQINNGVSANGTETDHVKGGSIEFLTRMGCSGPLCYRFFGQFLFGHVLTQGNPVCDGTLGVTGGPNGGPCPRQGTMSGGASIGFAVEFPRHRGYEDVQP